MITFQEATEIWLNVKDGTKLCCILKKKKSNENLEITTPCGIGVHNLSTKMWKLGSPLKLVKNQFQESNVIILTI